VVSVIISIYIVDEEAEVLAKRTIADLKKCLSGNEFIVVDDGSPYPHKIPCISKENGGNASAWNFGIKLAKYDIILLSDSDIKPHNLRHMTKCLKEDVGVVFPVRHEGHNDYRHPDGSFLMFRKSLWEKLEGFDESYGMYFEDTDFFKKVMAEGLKLVICEQSRITHFAKETVNKVFTDKEQKDIFKKNKDKFEAKHGKEYPYIWES